MKKSHLPVALEDRPAHRLATSLNLERWINGIAVFVHQVQIIPSQY